MHIDKFKTDSGYIDSSGCAYDDAESFIASAILGFCGCGDNLSALHYVRSALQLIQDLKTKVWANEITYDTWRVSVSEVFNSTGAEYFMWYFLDDKQLTEHGGSVPGWLTKKGQELLSDLNFLLKTAIENE